MSELAQAVALPITANGVERRERSGWWLAFITAKLRVHGQSIKLDQ
jgi:hypothetical protein